MYIVKLMHPVTGLRNEYLKYIAVKVKEDSLTLSICSVILVMILTFCLKLVNDPSCISALWWSVFMRNNWQKDILYCSVLSIMFIYFDWQKDLACFRWYKRHFLVKITLRTRQVYNGPRVVKFISAKRKFFWSKMIFEHKRIRKIHKSCVIND